MTGGPGTGGEATKKNNGFSHLGPPPVTQMQTGLKTDG